MKLSHTQCLPCPHQCEWATCHGQESTHVPMPTLVKGVTCSSHPVACAGATCSYCRDEELAQGVSCLHWNIQPGLEEWSGFSDAHQESLRHDDFCSSLSHADFCTSDPKTISKLCIDVVKTQFSCCYVILPIIRAAAQLLWHEIAT